jgi:hypothetical protein
MEYGFLLSPEYLPGTDMYGALKEQQQIVAACRSLSCAASGSACVRAPSSTRSNCSAPR